ncbi:MFS transporter [Streptomyces panaciradicis]|uniref:MFS transporter n=1 Tax=Streptomyces panaciradicis TaxID=1470261 RepID=UPI00201CFED1|nr:MFS transporter [Streptomyces panaciradicis]MCL6673326.1 MFS transporter [Streptomyces panaciradicis]
MTLRIVATVREFSPRTRAVLAVNAVNSFGGGLVLPFLWIYLGQVRGLPSWVPAATLAVQAATAVVGGLVWGAVLDRVAPRPVVTLVMCVAGAGTALYAVAVSAPAALTAALVYGLGISGVGTVLRFLYAGAATARERGLAFSADYAVFNAMTGLGVLVGGLVAAGGPGSDAARFAALYLADGTTFLLAGLAFLVLLPRIDDRTPESPAQAGEDRTVTGYGEVLRRPVLAVLFATLALCSLVSYGQLRSGLPGYLTGHGAVGPEGLSGTFAVNIVVAVLTQVLLGERIQRVRRSVVLSATGALWAAAWLLVLAAGRQHGAPATVSAMLGVLLLSVGEALVFPVLTGLINDLAEERVRGRVNAMLSVAISAGSVAGPLLAGATLPLAGGAVLIVALAGVCVGVVLVGTALRRTLPRAADLPAPEGDAVNPTDPAEAAEAADKAETAVRTAVTDAADTAPAAPLS